MNRTPMTRQTRLIYILVTAVVLVLVLGGTAFAGRLVTGKQIKNGSVTGVDIGNGRLDGSDVADGTLTRADFGALERGETGEQGPTGPTGPRGPQGPHGAHQVEYVIAERSVAPESVSSEWVAICPPGKRAVGGGASTSAPASTRITQSAPVDQGTGWLVQLSNASEQHATGYAWAVCAKVT